ncbi:MAG TPA: tRNA (adenosine(37)-N6)-dimethylallyltransferase MiaA [Acidimicrobiales bacterium]|nr:tRNA (adenosine(37)-N6)-dimethylallyltransferase MiaA [Acidimicrobiales bacterium]
MPPSEGRGDRQGRRHLALVGATASGKSALAMELARRLPDIELVSVDAMQVYRGMDIGTAKPTAAERAEVPHHLLDLAGPGEEYSVSAFQAEARRVIAGVEERGHRALLVGGTGLYLQAVVDDLAIPGQFPDARADVEADPDTAALHRRLVELDPVAAGRTEPTNRRRILRALEVTVGSGRPFSSYGPGIDRHPPGPWSLRGIWLPRPLVGERIAARYGQQLAAGFLDEVRALAAGPGLSRTARQALGYRELLSHVEEGADLDSAIADAVRRTRAFARRQRVWFRRDPRITWVGVTTNPMAALPALLGDWGRWPSSP